MKAASCAQGAFRSGLVLAVLLSGGTTLRADDTPATPQPRHALARHGAPAYPSDFKHFAYAAPDAPKGGILHMAVVGDFDSLNPFILKGVKAAGLNYLFDTLMTPSLDEPFAQYGLLAESVTISAAHDSATFTLRPEARFHDGTPVAPEDVVFSFDALRRDGHPFFRFYYREVEKAEVSGARQVTFYFSNPDNRELPLIIGNSLQILPRHWWRERDFASTSLEAPLGSGPYRILRFSSGRSVTYERVADYWGRDLAVNRGRYNFDVLRYDYYRDNTVALEAFKSGDYDFRMENQAKSWAEGYDFPARKAGFVVVENIRHKLAAGMQGFVFNTRRPLFSERKVRHALTLAYDFAWANRNLFHDSYTRTASYFANSELASSGAPAPEELALLAPFRDSLPREVFTQSYAPPDTKAAGALRANLREAQRLLKEAGWRIQDGVLTHQETGAVFAFEILLNNAQFERVAAPYVRNLKRLGITARIRLLQDSAQYQRRLDSFDFDMVVGLFPASLSPGNEQSNNWSSAAAATEGSGNLAGIRLEAVDFLVEAIIKAQSRKQLVTASRALDRVLLWGHYVVPHWHLNSFRIAWWRKFNRPSRQAPFDLGLDFWWFDEARAASLARGRDAPQP